MLQPSSGPAGKEYACQCRSHQKYRVSPWVGKVPWRRANNPLQYSCLENPMVSRAWQTTVHKVIKSKTQLKQLDTHTCSIYICINIWEKYMSFPYSSVGKESACNAGDLGSVPAFGRSPGEGNGNPLQYSCLENPMDRGAWRATVYGVTRVGHDFVTKPPREKKYICSLETSDPNFILSVLLPNI